MDHSEGRVCPFLIQGPPVEHEGSAPLYLCQTNAHHAYTRDDQGVGSALLWDLEGP